MTRSNAMPAMAIKLLVLAALMSVAFAGHAVDAQAICKDHPCAPPPPQDGDRFPDLLTVVDGPATAIRDQNVTYTITVGNQVSFPNAIAVDLEVKVPAGATYVSASRTCTTASRNGDTIVTCPLGTVSNRAPETTTITVRPDVVGPMAITGTALSSQDDGNTADDVDTKTTEVSPPPQPYADLALSLTDSPDPVTVGEELTYHARVTNQSVILSAVGPNDFPAPAANARIVQDLPPGMELVRTSRPSDCGATHTGTGHTLVTCRLGTVSPDFGAEEVDVVARPNAPGTFSSLATASSDTQDPSPANNSATISTQAQSEQTASIDDVTTSESAAAQTFHISLSRPADGDTAVAYQTRDGSAKSPWDYISTAGQVVFHAGEQTKDITVPLTADDVDEADEDYSVLLVSAQGARIADGTGTGTILDDDDAPQLSVGDVSTPEGDVGSTPANFTVALSHASAFDVTVAVSTRDGSATASTPDQRGDYTSVDDVVTIPAGQTSVTVPVDVLGDTRDEPDEDFTLRLGDTDHATVGDGSATGTIVDDDEPGDPPETSIESGPGEWSASPVPRFTLLASEQDDTFECRVVPDEFAPCTTPYRTRPLPDGEHTVEVRAVKHQALDAGGTRDIPDPTPATARFTVDTVAPNTTIASGPPAIANNPSPVFELRADEPLARFECRLTDHAAFNRCDARQAFTGLADGDYGFEARAIDRAGNVDASPATHSFTIDTTPPETKIGSRRPPMPPTVAGANGTNRVAVGGSGQAMLAVGCPEDAGTACDGDIAIDAGGVRVGQNAFDVSPGENKDVPVDLPASIQSAVERSGEVKVVATLTLEDAAPKRAKRSHRAGRTVAREDMVLTPDPRTARVRDAGRTLRTRGGAVAIRLACPRERASGCSGRVRVLTAQQALLGYANFKLKAGQARSTKVRLTRAARRMLSRGRSLDAVIEITTRQAGAAPVVKRVQINLRGGRR